MWLNADKIKELCIERGISLRTLLRQSGVSRTAYYSLLRAPTLLPTSLHKLSETLDLPVQTIISSGTAQEQLYRYRIAKLEKIMRRYPNANRENVWHTLVLLDLSPLERLQGAIRRGRR